MSTEPWEHRDVSSSAKNVFSRFVLKPFSLSFSPCRGAMRETLLPELLYCVVSLQSTFASTRKPNWKGQPDLGSCKDWPSLLSLSCILDIIPLNVESNFTPAFNRLGFLGCVGFWSKEMYSRFGQHQQSPRLLECITDMCPRFCPVND